MGQLDLIINVQIAKQVQSPNQPGFGVPLILGQHTRFADLIKYYTSAEDMLADGFLTSDAEYIHAVALMSQALSVELFGVGRRTAPVAQEDDISVGTVADNTSYTVTLNNLAATINSGVGATATSILTALKTAVDALAQDVVTSIISGPKLKILSNVLGEGFSVTLSANLTNTVVTANHGVQDDLNSILNDPEGDRWYGLILTSKTKADIMQAAALIETLKKIYIASSADADVKTTATDDVASKLKAKSYTRTALIYHTQAATQAPDAAWVGSEFPKVPGSSTYKFKELVGVDPDKFTANERIILIGTPGVPGKNANIYETIAGKNIMEEGFMAGGQFIDITVGIDWIAANMQTDIYAVLTSVDKVPFTDKGIALVENQMRAVISEGIVNGLIADDPAPIFTIPKALSVPVADRANRLLPNMHFECRLAGAIHFVKVKGIVTV